MLDGFETGEGTEDLCQGSYSQQVTQKPSCYVDLAAMRRDGVTYEKVLSQKARKQIRRCIRQYEATGEISLSEPAAYLRRIGLWRNWSICTRNRGYPEESGSVFDGKIPQLSSEID